MKYPLPNLTLVVNYLTLYSYSYPGGLRCLMARLFFSESTNGFLFITEDGAGMNAKRHVIKMLLK